MATGGDKSVDNRGVVCSVCLEPYRGRQPKLLPCYHTFCLPCLLKLAHTQPQVPDGASHATGEGGPKTGTTSITITCPTCRNNIFVPPGGVQDFQSNFYVDGDGDTTSLALAKMQSDNGDPNLKEQIKNHLKVMEAVLARLDEDEGEISRHRRALDDDIQTRYATGLCYLSDARDQSLISLRDAAQAAHDKLEADKMFAKMLLTNLTQLASQERSAKWASNCGLLNDSMLRHFSQLASRVENNPFFTYSTTDNYSSLLSSLREFMGNVSLFGHVSEPPLPTAVPTAELRTENTQQGTNSNSAEMLKIRNELAALQSQNSQLRQDLNVVMSDSTHMSKDFRMLQDDVGDLLKSVADVRTDNTRLSTDVDTVKRDVTASMTDTTNLTAEIDNVRKDVAKLQLDVVLYKSESTKLSTDVSTMQTDVARLQDHVDAVNTDNCKLSTEVSTMQTNLGTVQHDVAEVKTDTVKLSTAVTTALVDIAKLQQDTEASETVTAKLRAEMKSVQNDVSRLQGDVAIALDDSARLSTNVSTMQNELFAEIQCHVAAASIGNASLNAGVGAKQSDDTKPQHGITTTDIPKDSIQLVTNANSAEIIRLRHELTSLQTQNSCLRRDLNTIQDDTSQLNMHVGTLQKDVVNIHQVMTFVQAENSRLSADCVTWEKRVESVESETQRLLQDLDKLQKDNGEIHQSVDNLQMDSTKLNNDVDTVQKDVGKLQQDVAASKSDHAKLASCVSTSQKDVSKLQVDVRYLKQDVTALRTETDNIAAWGDGPAIQKDLQVYRGEIKSVQVTVNGLQDALVKCSRVVAFHAKLPSFIITQKPQTLVLRDVITNLGGGYDAQTGVFTAPVSGTYIFMATTSPNIWGNNNKTRFAIMVDDKEQGRAWAQGDNSSTGHVVVEVTAGQRVWMQSKGNDYYFAGSGLTYFCGVLVRSRLS